MRKRATTSVLIVIGVIVLGLMAVLSLKVYYLRDDSGGQLLWNPNEAYLFVHVARRGLRLGLLEYPYVAFKEWVHEPAVPTDQRVFFTVIRVTESGIEHHVAKVADDTADIPHFFTPVGQTIYAYNQGTVCKWVGDHFESATQEEQQKFDGINHLAADVDANINGWSKRGVGAVAGDSQYSIEIGKQLKIVVKLGNVYRSVTDSAAVDLERAGQPAQRLWHVDGRPRRVSRREYEQALFVER